jgi:N-acetylmuramoyl-L-alanine amidase
MKEERHPGNSLMEKPREYPIRNRPADGAAQALSSSFLHRGRDRFRARVLLAVLCLAFSLRAASAFTTVVIDPGHGGADRGGIPGQRVPEKVMALDTARRLEIRLRAAGFHTVMTRWNDTFISLPERVAIANAQRNAIFISIHFNATPRPEAEGFETYYYSRRSAKLAEACYSRIIQAWPGSRRGIRTRGFFVIRKTNIPSVLVEPGFLTNPREAALISRPEIRQRLADLLADAIISKRRM